MRTSAFLFDLDGTLVDSVYHLFVTAARQLDADVTAAVVVGDSVWDLLAAPRARALGVGLLSGGYGQDELERAGAYRAYHDPADLLRHLDEVGVRTSD